MNPISRFVAPLAIGGIAYLMYPSPAPETAASTSAGLSAATAPAPHAGPSFALPSEADYPQLPATPSSRSPVFALGQNGELLLEPATAIRLDLLLADLPARPAVQELQHIEERATEGLPENAARKALRILNDYIAYRRAESELETQPGIIGTMSAQAMLDRLIALRREHLGQQVADALFATAEAQARFGIQATQIEAHPTLTRQEKAQRIEALRQALPADAALPDAGAAQAVHAVEDQVPALRRQGATEADIWQLREQSLGTESAQVITGMEAQQMEWERRYQAFLQQKNAILAAPESSSQKQEKIETLLRQHYSEQELATARAYDAGNLRQ